MSSNSYKKCINVSTIDFYLSEVSKKYRKLSNKNPIQLIIVGGSSIVINYGFRENTEDIDAYFGMSDAMKQAIHQVADEQNLPNDWLNDSFSKTTSFSRKLIEHSTYYKTFSNVVEVRTIKGEYLIAMKLVSGRIIKNDISDIVGILLAEKRNGQEITLSKINKAVTDLYDSLDVISDNIKTYLFTIMENYQKDDFYERVKAKEISNRDYVKKEAKTLKHRLDKKSFDKLIEEVLTKSK